MFRIKICGITNVDDALASTDAGADAIGINFYSGSKRCVNAGVAGEITAAVSDRCIKVGVVVDQTPSEVKTLADGVGLDAIQLHGDQPTSCLLYLLKEETRHRIIRVHRLADSSLDRIRLELLVCEELGRLPDAVLLDAASPGEFGGTGRTLDWSELASEAAGLAASQAPIVPLILAGGLTPENVAEAIRTVRPYGVDTASGVESSPGKKDPHKVRDFVAEARRGFAEIGVI